MSTAFDEQYFTHYFQWPLQPDRLSARKHRHYLRALQRAAAQGPLLEVGCAYGQFAHRAADRFEVFACDLCPVIAARAAAATPGGRFFVAALPDLAVGEERFSTVVCADVVEHVPEADAALAALSGALRPGGALLLVVPVYDGPLGVAIRRLDHDPTHVHRHGRRWWLDRVRDHGFELVNWEGVIRYRPEQELLLLPRRPLAAPRRHPPSSWSCANRPCRGGFWRASAPGKIRPR